MKILCGVTLAGTMAIAGCGMLGGGSAPAKAPPPPAPAVATESRDSSQSVASLRNVQTALINGGFYAGPVDGVWGPATEKALRAYQQANSLGVTGKLDADTMVKLNPPASN